MVKGRGLLKGMSIVLIVFGAILLLLALAGFSVAKETSDTLSKYSVDGSEVENAVNKVAIVWLITAVIELVSGIFGIISCKNTQKAKLCFIFGIAIIALQLLSVILSGGIKAFSIVGFVIPVLYTVAAFRVKSNA